MPPEAAEGGQHYFLTLEERRQALEALSYSETRRTKGRLLF